jgi:flagellar protein FliO/FliZ
MNGLFGLELPTSVNFVIAFVVVLALIGAATWLVRRFGAPRLEAGGRNRQPRLAVLDSAAVDGRRKLVIIRRDNVEHLLMIGGPTDVVVETNIVRAPPGLARETPAVRVNGGETLPRAMPLPDTTHWPLQPEPSVPARPERVDPSQQWPEPAAIPAPPAAAPPPPAPPPAPAPTLRAQRDPLAGIAADPVHTAPPVTHVPMPAPAPAPAAPRPAPAPRPAAKVAPPVQLDPQTAAVNDQNLANMAQQLEAALRRPVGGAAPPEAAKRAEPAMRPPAPKPAAPAAPVAPAAAAPKPTHSIEQEMASLLGRPGKS